MIIVLLIYLTFLTFIKNPLEYNYSMLTDDPRGYFLVLGLTVLLSLWFYKASVKLNNKYAYLAIGPMIGALLPYKAFSGDISSNLHELLAYVAFFMTVLLFVLNVKKYQEINYKKAITFFRIFVLIVSICLVFYFDKMGVNSLQEYLILCTISILYKLMLI